jgi:hypothetical protein
MVRRTFIRQLARGGLLAGLAGAAGILISRDQVTLRSDCSANFQCRNCNKLTGCQLPEAQKTREGYGEEG